MAGFVEVERRTRSRSFFLSFFFFFTFEIFRSKREREGERGVDRSKLDARKGGEDRGGATKYNCLVRGSIEEARARPTR